MKNLMSAAILPWLLMAFGHKAIAQETPDPSVHNKESQEIIIRKKGDKDATLNLQFTDDKVIVNGKPLVEFNDDGITINKKRIVINGDKLERELNGIINDFHFDDFGKSEISFGGKPRAFLGVSTEKVDDGARIINVTKGSAAEIVGLKKDDVITKINDKKVNGPEELYKLINGMKVKDEVTVTYKRDGNKRVQTARAILKETSGADMKSISITSPEGDVRSFSFPRDAQGRDAKVFKFDQNDMAMGMFKKQKLGIKIQDTEEENGVKILDVDAESPAATAGIKKEDVLIEMNGKKITNTDDAREEMQQNSDNSNYPVKIKRNGTEMTLVVKIPKKLKTADL